MSVTQAWTLAQSVVHKLLITMRQFKIYYKLNALGKKKKKNLYGAVTAHVEAKPVSRVMCG